MATIQDLEKLGYTVGVAQDHSENKSVDTNLVYRVEGFGISTMVNDNDQEAIDSLADKAAHAERKLQHENPEMVQAESE